MRYFINPLRCDSCVECESACTCHAIHHLTSGRGRRLRPLQPVIDQDLCDGCERQLVPECIKICNQAAIAVNMLV